MDARLRDTLAAIDAVNAEDPNRLVVRGEERPKALGEAELATDWVTQLVPEPSAALLLAVRAHHLRRWTIPRSTYPDGRAGYLRWRRDLHDVHADDVAVIMGEHGWDDATVTRVQDIIRKRGLGRINDAELQAFEDALCLVFIETQYDALAGRLADETMTNVVDKTLKKMSAQGQALAATLR
ncbi:MAG: DUF4202 domain-containing protein [Actinobacteria bacterium]|nr:DUF4202 domain-containing protein [Actinomycetota bacterium]